MTQPDSQEPETLEQKLDNAKGFFRHKFENEIEHIRRVHPEAKLAATIIRDVGGAYLAVYDFERSETEPVYISGINPNDWALVVTAFPGHGLALPVRTWPELEAAVAAGLTAEHEAAAAKVEA